MISYGSFEGFLSASPNAFCPQFLYKAVTEELRTIPAFSKPFLILTTPEVLT